MEKNLKLEIKNIINVKYCYYTNYIYNKCLLAKYLHYSRNLNKKNAGVMDMKKMNKKIKSCCMFNIPESEFKESKDFEVIKKYGSILSPNDCTRNLLKCNKCGALFLSQFLEWNDHYYHDYIQVEDIMEADKLNNELDSLKFRNKNNPMIMIGSDKVVHYILPKFNAEEKK